MRTVIYVACPMRIGGWTANVRKAAKIGRDLILKGYSVINPMGSWLLDTAAPMEFEDWIENDYGLIHASDAIFRIPGESEGADLEVQFANSISKPVFFDLAELYRDFPNIK